MAINYRLATEIYGMTPWMMDSMSFPALSTILQNMRNGIDLEIPDEKYNAVSFFKVTNETKVIDRPFGPYYNPGQLDGKEQFDGIGIININGPITKSGGASSYGIDYVSQTMLKMAQDERIKGFVIVGNSGGGSSSAVEIMTDTINQVKEKLPVYSLIEKGGMAASAMYGIMAASNKIYAEHEMSIVGSIGTMIQFEGKAANTESPDGTKNIRLYATKSIKKNIEMESALNDNNYDLLISELLDPINERFIEQVQSNRPILNGTDFSNGNTKFAKDSVGTYIDGIKSFSQVVDEVMADYNANYKPTSTKKTKNNSKTNSIMTEQELRNEHPDLYAAVFAAGVKQENERVGVWLAHHSSDPESVRKGIESNASLSAVERENFLVKASVNGRLNALKTESAAAITTPPSGSKVESEEVTETESFYADVKNLVK